MTLMAIAITVAWTAAAALMAWHAATVLKEVTYVTLADGRRQERSLPATFRLLLPFTGNLDRLFELPFFAERAEKAGATLVSAGFEGLLDGREFITLRMLVPAVFGTVWCATVIVAGAFVPFLDGGMCAPLCLLGVGLFAVHPGMWLKKSLAARYLSIMKALPFVLDLLTLSVEAGMDFMSAIRRNCTTRKMDPLNEELLRMTKEIQVGSSRKEALSAMAARCGQPDLKSFAFALVQADELGVPSGTVLRIQAEQMRSKRFDRAEKLANEMPVKMLGPLILCIFPAVFIILLGPVISQAVKEIF